MTYVRLYVIRVSILGQTFLFTIKIEKREKMLDILNKAALSYEKHLMNLLDELINCAQPFTIVSIIDETWQELFNPQYFEILGTTELDIFISKENTINVFLSKENNINYFNYILEDSDLINNQEGKLKIRIPIIGISKTIICSVVSNNYLASPVYTKPITLSQKEIVEFNNI